MAYLKPQGYLDLSAMQFIFRPLSGDPRGILQKLGAYRSKDGLYRLPRVYFVLKLLEGEVDLKKSPRVEAWERRVGTIPPLAADHPRIPDLYPHQKEALSFLLTQENRGALLLLSPRLGKSIISILYGEILFSRTPRILIVAPLILLSQWERQIQEWGYRGWPITIVRGKDEVPPTGWVVTNYDTLTRQASRFGKFDLVIFDETVLLKNRKALRVRQSRKVSQGAKVLLLSGSPISRYIDDLWAQLNLIDCRVFSSYWRFVSLFCETQETPWGTECIGSKPFNFRELFKDVVFTRTEAEVGNLPVPEYETLYIPLEGPQLTMYHQARKEALLKLSSGEELSILSKMSLLVRLQQITSGACNLDPDLDASVKRKALEELIDAGGVEFPLLIWVFWRNEAERLARSLSAPLIFGDTPSSERQRILEAYQKGDIPILVLSLPVGKFGVTLPNTRTVVYYDKTWDADDIIQSRYRTRLLGASETARVISLVIPGTTDQLISENLARKFQDLSRLTNQDLRDLLASLGGDQ